MTFTYHNVTNAAEGTSFSKISEKLHLWDNSFQISNLSKCFENVRANSIFLHSSWVPIGERGHHLSPSEIYICKGDQNFVKERISRVFVRKIIRIMDPKDLVKTV